jgi:hypothetical protein
MENTYSLLRKKYPNKDEHYYLAQTWLMRYKPLLKPPNEELVMMAYNETYIFAVLSPPDSIRALALYVVYQECKQYNKSLPIEYDQEFKRIMEPIIEMQENNPEEFIKLYKKKNPNIAKEFDNSKE